MEELYVLRIVPLLRVQAYLILSDRGVDEEYAAIPALLAVSGTHHHLIREGTERKSV